MDSDCTRPTGWGSRDSARAVRRQIILEYAKWTAMSAARIGSPIRSRKVLYPLLDGVLFDEVLSRNRGAIRGEEFDRWHERETCGLCGRANDLAPEAAPLPVGWSAKLINVFLKTAVYVGDLGRDGLRAALHPPIDAGLRRGLEEHFPGQAFLGDVLVARSISQVRCYATYRMIIGGCREAARKQQCALIELEQFAGLGVVPGDDRRHWPAASDQTGRP